MNEPDKNYIDETKNGLFDWAYTHPDHAKEFLDDLLGEDKDGKKYIDVWLYNDYDLTCGYGADEATGERDGAYYTETSKAVEAIVERGVLVDPQFLAWIGEHDGRHLEDLFRDGGFDLVDVWYRKYVLERCLTTTEILAEIQNGIKSADPQYEKLEITTK